MGSDKGLVLNWREAIIWTSDGLVYWHRYASLASMSNSRDRAVKSQIDF